MAAQPVRDRPAGRRPQPGHGHPSRRDEVAVRLFVERMAITLADWGFPRMPARVLMTVMAADEPGLSAAMLGERLGISPAAVSGATRYLIRIGMLRREPQPGSRRDLFRLPDDAWYEASTAERAVMRTLSDLADDGVAALGADTASGRRMALMRDFFRFVDAEMDGLLTRWKQRQAGPQR